MNQFNTIFNFEFKNFLKNKVFVGVTIFLMVVIFVVMFIPRFTASEKNKAMDKESTAQSSEASDIADPPIDDGKKVMLIASLDGTEEGDAIEAFKASFSQYNVKAFDGSMDDLKKQITDGKAECAIVLEGMTKYTYYVDNLSMYDFTTDVIDETLTNVAKAGAMAKEGLSPEKIEEIMSVNVEGEAKSLGIDQANNYWYTYIMIFALYFVIILYGQMVATNVASEKSSRAMEVLITSAKPTAMMFGKVLASCLAGMLQLVLIFGTAIVCYTINRPFFEKIPIVDSIFGMPLSLLGYMIVFFLLGFLIYAFLYGAIGSTVSKLEDVNTSVMPVTFLYIIAFIVVMFSISSSNVDTTIMKVCSFIPFTSPMAMFARIAMSEVPVIEIIISIVILFVSVILVGVISARIYRVGVLMYGKKPKLSELIKNAVKH